MARPRQPVPPVTSAVRAWREASLAMSGSRLRGFAHRAAGAGHLVGHVGPELRHGRGGQAGGGAGGVMQPFMASLQPAASAACSSSAAWVRALLASSWACHCLRVTSPSAGAISCQLPDALSGARVDRYSAAAPPYRRGPAPASAAGFAGPAGRVAGSTRRWRRTDPWAWRLSFSSSSVLLKCRGKGQRIRPQAIWLRVLRKRASENMNSAVPISARARKGFQTTSIPAPR